MDEVGRTWQWPALHAATITQVAFSPDGTRLVTAADDSTIRAWDLKSDKLEPAFENNFSVVRASESNFLKGHADAIASLSFLGNSNDVIVTSSLDRSIRVWNLKTYSASRKSILEGDAETATLLKRQSSLDTKPLRLVPDEAPSRTRYRFAMFHPQERAVSKAPALPRAKPKPLQEAIKGHVGEVTSVAFAPDGKRFVTAGQDQTTQVWMTDTGERATQDNVFTEGHSYNISGLRFVAQGRYLATASYDGTLLLWDTKDDNDGLGREVARRTGLGMSNALTASDDGTLILTSTVTVDDKGQQQYGAELWQTTDLIDGMRMTPNAELKGAHEARVSSLAISPNRTRIVSADRFGKIAVWSADGRLLKKDQTAHDDGVSANSLRRRRSTHLRRV